MSNHWPKILPPLTPEQQRVSDDFVEYWHHVLPSRYSLIDQFNHSYPVKHAPATFLRTLELGAGLGEHLKYEKLSLEQHENYFCLDLRSNMVEVLHQTFPDIQAIVHDCQEPLPIFADGYFDRILAIHVLEHLPNLPAAIQEAYRLINKERGVFSVVIPCEGELAYSVSRRVSAQRIFERRYNQSYKWFIEREHINRAQEILAELKPYFTVVHRRSFPFPFIPVQALNLVIGLTLKPRAAPLLPVS